MNQKIVTVVPTLKRPEMLALTLEALSRTRPVFENEVQIYVDHTTDARLTEVEYVRDIYYPAADIFHAGTHCLVPSGTWNILQSLKAGYETGADYIAFVEEDVLVTPDFYQRHLELQNSGDYFVTCGRKLPYFDDAFYSNPGTMYRREKLVLVIPHINERYFANQKDYIEKNFPRNDNMGILDDGLIRHIMWVNGGKARCAVPRICAHVGFHFYNRQPLYINQGKIEDRIAWLREFLSDIPARKAADPRYLGDLEELR